MLIILLNMSLIDRAVFVSEGVALCMCIMSCFTYHYMWNHYQCSRRYKRI